METLTSKAYEYVNSDEVAEHSIELQKEAIDNKDDTTFIVHNIKLDIIRKTDIKTDKIWTDEQKKQLHNATRDFLEKFYDFLAKELQNNSNLGMLELDISTQDFKRAVSIKLKEQIKKFLNN